MTISRFTPQQSTTHHRHTDDQILRGDLTTREAANYLSVSKALLEKWRCKGGGPRYVKYGTRIVRYCAADLDAFRDQFRTEG